MLRAPSIHWITVHPAAASMFSSAPDVLKVWAGQSTRFETVSQPTSPNAWLAKWTHHLKIKLAPRIVRPGTRDQQVKLTLHARPTRERVGTLLTVCLNLELFIGISATSQNAVESGSSKSTPPSLLVNVSVNQSVRTACSVKPGNLVLLLWVPSIWVPRWAQYCFVLELWDFVGRQTPAVWLVLSSAGRCV